MELTRVDRLAKNAVRLVDEHIGHVERDGQEAVLRGHRVLVDLVVARVLGVVKVVRVSRGFARVSRRASALKRENRHVKMSLKSLCYVTLLESKLCLRLSEGYCFLSIAGDENTEAAAGSILLTPSPLISTVFLRIEH